MMLAHDVSPDVRLVVAGNRNAAPDALATNAQRAESDSGPRTVLEQQRPAVHELRAIAANPSTPAPTLTKVARSKRWDVRAWVAANPSCPNAHAPLAREGLVLGRARPSVAGMPDDAPNDPDENCAAMTRRRFSYTLAGNPSTPTPMTRRFPPKQHAVGDPRRHERGRGSHCRRGRAVAGAVDPRRRGREPEGHTGGVARNFTRPRSTALGTRRGRAQPGLPHRSRRRAPDVARAGRSRLGLAHVRSENMQREPTRQRSRRAKSYFDTIAGNTSHKGARPGMHSGRFVGPP